MHFSALPTLAVLTVGYFSIGAFANSGYGGSCNSLQEVAPTSNHNHYSIDANCKKSGNNAPYNVGTFINIDRCFGNSGGNLVGQAYGGFGASCHSVSLKGTILHATCSNGRGGENQASIDTNNWIGNADGVMCCFNLCSDGN